MGIVKWLTETDYVPGKWRLTVRDNGNEFTGPRLQYSVFGPGVSYTFEDK